MRKTRSNTPKAKKPPDVFKQRLQYVCELLFGGKYTKFAEAAGFGKSHIWFGRVVYYDTRVTKKVLAALIKTGLVNAEYLMCGTGPACSLPQFDVPDTLMLPNALKPHHDYFDSSTVQFAAQIDREFLEVDVTDTAPPLDLARAIHAARSIDAPVVLYLNEARMLEGAGVFVAQMLRKKYVTALVCTATAAYRDVEYARYEQFSKRAFDNALIDINDAALFAANNGLGYGEAIGRWCFPKQTRRDKSVIATAYELGLPVVVHTTIGDSVNHWFPSKRGAELGAAIGAASYADMLVFAEQLRRCVGLSCGVFIPAEQNNLEFLELALRAIESDASALPINIMSYLDMLDISGEHRRTFSALLTACDAVYDGSADNGKRPCRVRRD